MLKIGEPVYVRGFVDEIRSDTIIIRNEGGYFGTVSSEIVEAVPVVYAKWTKVNNYAIENKYDLWKCSYCGFKVIRANPLKGNLWNYYYCPSCGARMTKADE